HPPEFLVPVSDVACERGDNVTLRCKVCGRPRATVTWRGPDNSTLSNSSRYSVTYSETGEAVLNILGVSVEDGGVYTSEFVWKSFESYYTETSELGRGRFSVAKRCEQRGSKRSVVAKHVNKRLLRREQALREVRLLQSLDHPNLVGLLDTYQTATSYVLVLEM
ncbi:hypothetical protein CRUP_006443, partial [Coryphaenoides rupestris]